MSSADLGEEFAPYLSAQSIIILPVSTLSVLFFLYGIYCTVFGLAIYPLCQRESSAHRLYKWGSIALFIVATVYAVALTCTTLRQTFLCFQTATTKDYSPLIQYRNGDEKKSVADGFINFPPTFMNILADSMLIHRCYIICNSNKLILYPLAFVAFILNGIDFGCVAGVISSDGNPHKTSNRTVALKSVTIDHGAVIGIAIFQVILSSMTAGRLWWITREARKLLPKSPSNARFKNIIAIIIESAMMYAATLLTGILLEYFVWDPNFTGVIPFDFTVISTLMSGLAPTMVIARVAYGKSVDSVQETLSTFQIANRENSHQHSITARSGFQHQTQHGGNVQEEECLSHSVHDPQQV